MRMEQEQVLLASTSLVSSISFCCCNFAERKLYNCFWYILSGENPNNENELTQMLIAVHYPGLRGEEGLFNYDFTYIPGLDPKCIYLTPVGFFFHCCS